jgi:hypothetical protein
MPAFVGVFDVASLRTLEIAGFLAMVVAERHVILKLKGLINIVKFIEYSKMRKEHRYECKQCCQIHYH